MVSRTGPGSYDGEGRPEASPPPRSTEQAEPRVHVALCTSITVLLPSRKNPKAFTTYTSDLATYTSPYFHSCRISGSKNLSNFSGIEEMKSEVST